MKSRATNTPGYYVLLLVLGALVLGPLATLSGTYMNFRLGFFLGGSILAGALGSVIVFVYGKEARHGANYIQTLVSAMGSLAAMSAVIQTHYWLDLPLPSTGYLILFAMSTGLFGMGIGTKFTPLLVDRWQLKFPSGKAVADMLRAFTDVKLLKKSLATLFGGAFFSFLLAMGKIPFPASWAVQGATTGAGIIVGARIALPAVVMGAIGWLLTPYLTSIGWLEPGQDYRMIGFYISLAMIFGASVVDVAPAVSSSVKKLLKGEIGNSRKQGAPIWWIVLSGAVMVLTAWLAFDVPLFYVLLAVLLATMFCLMNGISVGVADANPISSAFVVTVLLLIVAGVKAISVALMCSMIVFIAVANGVDLLQDRRTGSYLGSNRMTQTAFNAIGVIIGAPVAVYMAMFFLETFPVLKAVPTSEVAWSSAMTLKMVGALQGIGGYEPHQLKALLIGLVLGLAISLLRKRFKRVQLEDGRMGFSRNKPLDFVVDTVVLPLPYASSFGGFVPFILVFWFGIGGTIRGIFDAAKNAFSSSEQSDESATTNGAELTGVGLIVGETAAYTWIGLASLWSTFF